MASKEENRDSAKKVAEGKSLTQDEQRALDRARSTAGSESRALKRIAGGGKT